MLCIAIIQYVGLSETSHPPHERRYCCRSGVGHGQVDATQGKEESVEYGTVIYRDQRCVKRGNVFHEKGRSARDRDAQA